MNKINPKMKVALQLDFDGTVTVEDISYLLLDTYADRNWRELLKDYLDGNISVGKFNREVFAMVKADRQTMLKMVINSEKLLIRPGLRELSDFCTEMGYRAIIVSNGLTFYIEAILRNLGIDNIEVYAAENKFSPDGIQVKYVGPDGDELDNGLKETYTARLLTEDYYTIYIGDGLSDIPSAKIASKVFAIGDLLERCREYDIKCILFNDFFDVIRELKTLVIV